MSFSKLDRFKKNVKPIVPRKNIEETENNSNNTTVNNEIQTSQQQTNPSQSQILQPSSPHSDFPEKSGRRIVNNTLKTNKVTPPLNNNPFNEPDSKKNIIFLDKIEIKQVNDSLELQDNVDERQQIKGATLIKLIERVTSEKYADPNFQSDFLLTFRSFTNPRELLDLLIKRYNTPPPKGLSYGELQDFKQNKQRPIRLRVINFIKNWLEKNWKDFTDDEYMNKKLYEFLMTDMMQTGNQTPAQQLANLLAKKREEPEQEREIIFSEIPPKPFLLNLKKVSSASFENLTLMDLHSEEIARQLTLIEYNLYKAIKPWEFFNQSWTKKDKEILSPNIIKMIKRFNLVSNWVTTEIVKTEQLKQRISILNKFIEVADKCRSYNNFNALMEILSGLQSSSVFRLKQTWNGLPSKQRELFEELKELMSRQGNFNNLRKHLKTCNPPLIPYLGVFLTDLTFIEDGNPDLLEGGLINWLKRRKLAAVLKDIQQYQQKPYCLEEVSFIREFLLKCEPFDEDQCYKLSLQREIRVSEKDISKKTFPNLLGKLRKDNTNSPTQKKNSNIINTPSSPQQIQEEIEEEEDFEIEYKSGYKFYDKDSEHNIIIEKNSTSEADIIIAGTLPKLVERLTYEKYPDVNYLTSFLMTYRTFTTAHELLDLLIMRYKIPPPVNATPELMERFKQKKEMPIMLRVLNVLKTWVDKFFDDFKEDRTLLTKLIDFIDKCMIASQSTMSRAGENLKIQIANKLETKEDKKKYQFDSEPPKPILPKKENPALLDYNPLELARQLTLIDFELFTAIKPLEYLYFNKPISWNMFEEELLGEDEHNLKNSPHIVQVVYRFSDVRDWVATEIMKIEDKNQRAKVIEHFIQISQCCVMLKNFQATAEIISALSFDFVIDLKSTWKLIPKNTIKDLLEMKNLLSVKDSYKSLKDKLQTLDYPCIPYIGAFIHDLTSIKEQMPDTIEPFSFVNFSKRQKLSNLIKDLYNYQQQPFCLESVPKIQEYLKSLDIYELSAIKELSQKYQELDGDKNISENILDITPSHSPSISRSSSFISNNPLTSASNSPSLGPSPRNSISLPNSPFLKNNQSLSKNPVSNVSNNHVIQKSNSFQKSGNISKGSKNGTPNASPPSTPRHNSGSSQTISTPNSQESLSNQEISSLSNQKITNSNSQELLSNQKITNSNSQESYSQESLSNQKISNEQLKFMFLDLLKKDQELKKEIKDYFDLDITKNSSSEIIDSVLRKHFPGSTISNWNAQDNQGTVYGWPENINAKVIQYQNELYIVPLSIDGVYGKITKADLSVNLRVVQLYEQINRFTITQRPKIGILGTSIEEKASQIAHQIHLTFISF